MNIRPAHSNDFDQVCALFNESHAFHHEQIPHFFKDTAEIQYKKSTFANAFQGASEVILVADNEEKLVGAVHVIIHEMTDENKHSALNIRRYGLVQTLVVDAEFRQHGLGHKLLEAVDTWLKEEGIKEVELVVWSFNHEAQKLYEAVGYKPLNLKMHKRLD